MGLVIANDIAETYEGRLELGTHSNPNYYVCLFWQILEKLKLVRFDLLAGASSNQPRRHRFRKNARNPSR